MSFSSSSSSAALEGAYMRNGTPSLSTRNLVKFHLIVFINVLEQVSFRKEKSGVVSPKLTLTLET